MKTRIILILIAAALAGCVEKYESPFAGADNYIFSFHLEKDGVTLNASIVKDEILLAVPETFSLDGAVAAATLSENASIDPPLASINNWAAEHSFTVSSFNGTSNTYKYRVLRSAVSAAGDVVLLSQADVEAFAALQLTSIDGSLTIGAAAGEDSVRSLAPLNGLKIITRTLSINATFAGGDLNGLESLETLGSLRIVGSQRIRNLSLPRLKTVPVNIDIDNSAVRSLDFPELVEIGKNLRVYYADSLRLISLPKLRKIVGDLSLTGRYGATVSVETLDLPELESIDGIMQINTQPLLRAINLPRLKTLSLLAAGNATSINVSSSAAVEQISAPSLESSRAINLNNVVALKTLDLRSLYSLLGAFGISNGRLIETLDLGKLQTVVGSLSGSAINALTEINLPELREVSGSFNFEGSNLKRINCPRLETAATLYIAGPALDEVNFPKLKDLTSSLSIQSPVLTSLDGLSALETVNSISISGATALTSISGLSSLRSAASVSFNNVPNIGEIDLSGVEVATALSISGTSWTSLTRVAGADDFAGRLNFSVQGVSAMPLIEGFRRTARIQISTYGIVNFDAPWMEEVAGDLSCSFNDVINTVNLPNLRSVGSLNIPVTAVLNLPELTTVGGYFGITLTQYAASIVCPKLRSISGNLSVTNTSNVVLRPFGLISFPVLETIGGTLSLNNSYTAVDFPNFTNLDGFAALRSVKGVTITRFANLVDFTGLKNAIPSFTRYEWNVTYCGYNPTYQDMLDGRYEL
ncbi:MAG: hypothetical protein LBC98_04615 [Prevotellaceae bacterium]|jgi:hypothetical protein|nr:hypothetical protein [Prevotellaceae bacterium]